MRETGKSLDFGRNWPSKESYMSNLYLRTVQMFWENEVGQVNVEKRDLSSYSG